MSKLIKVTAISDVRLDKNQREFKLITVSNPTKEQVVDEDTGEVFTVLNPNVFSASFLAYKESYLDNQTHVGWDARIGDAFKGLVVQRVVEQAYPIPTRNSQMPGNIGSVEDALSAGFEEGIDFRVVNTYKTIVFADTEDKEAFELATRKAFRAKGHPIKGDVEAVKLPASPRVITIANTEAVAA